MKKRTYCLIGMMVVGEMILSACDTKVIEQAKASEIEKTVQQETVTLSNKKQEDKKQDAKEEVEKTIKPKVDVQNKAGEDKALKALREQMQKENKQLAAAFLGYGTNYESLEKKADYEKKYSFIGAIDKAHYVAYEGDEFYAIVPESKKWKLSIYALAYNEKTEAMEQGKCLYEAQDGEPIILKCNLSDIMSNVRISISTGLEAFAWEPSVSLMESVTLSVSPMLYDFSIYGGESGAEGSSYLYDMAGEWRCEKVPAVGGGSVDYTITFYTNEDEEQGDMLFGYYPSNDDYTSYLKGSYFCMGPDDENQNIWQYMFVLNAPEGEKRGMISLEHKGETLSIKELSGDSFFILAEGKKQELHFVAFDAAYQNDVSAQACYQILCEIVEVQDCLASGMSLYYEETTTCINGKECLVFVLGTDREEQFVRECYYAVSLDKSVYKMEPISGEWQAVAFG